MVDQLAAAPVVAGFAAPARRPRRTRRSRDRSSTISTVSGPVSSATTTSTSFITGIGEKKQAQDTLAPRE
jgi:hypothetical protein